VDENTLLSLQLELSIRGASCEWSDTGNCYARSYKTQNQL